MSQIVLIVPTANPMRGCFARAVFLPAVPRTGETVTLRAPRSEYVTMFVRHVGWSPDDQAAYVVLVPLHGHGHRGIERRGWEFYAFSAAASTAPHEGQ